MATDRWGTPVHVDFLWACRDADGAATDSCLSIRIGPEISAVDARFYEDNLPEVRSLVASLLRQMTLQENGAASHDRITTEGVEWLLEEMERLKEALPTKESTPDA